MNFLKKFFVGSFVGAITISPFFLVLSCSNSSSDEDKKIEETKLLQSFFDKNTNAFSPKGTSIEIKNFVEFSSWKNLDDLISQNYLGKYFTIDPSFKTELQKNNNAIYNKIKKVVIQPKPGSTQLTCIFYLNKSTSDLNIVSVTIQNALDSSFSYENEISIEANPTIDFYENKESFDNDWKKWSNDKDKTTLQTILVKAFGLLKNSNEINKIINNVDDFEISSSSYRVTLKISSNGIQNGFIFKIGEQYNTTITSNYLIKEV